MIQAKDPSNLEQDSDSNDGKEQAGGRYLLMWYSWKIEFERLKRILEE